MKRALLCLSLSLLVCLGYASVASGAHVQCGDVLTQDTTLDSDLTCPGDALEIGADGVKLDLAGHVMTGTPNGAVAVDNFDGFDGLTVTRGTIRGFSSAVRVFDSTGGEISRLTYERGLILQRSEGYLIKANSTPGGVVFAYALSGSRLVRNEFDQGGIQILSGSDNVIDRNVIRFAPGPAGISLGTAANTVVTRNVIRAAQTAFGIEVFAFSAATTVERNEITGGSNGIRLASVREIALLRNHVSGGAADGILATNTDATLFERNRTQSNGDDGIDVDSRGQLPGANTLTRNVANFNGDLGIEAVAGTIDGGGNKAKGNGNPAQCVGVACS